MIRYCIAFWVLCAAFLAPALAVAGEGAAPLPREILSFYDSKYEGDPKFTRTHRFLEMPLNHLGFTLSYHDIRQPLPEITPQQRGITVWFTADTQLEDPEPFFDWLHRALDKGKKLLVINKLGESDTYRESPKNLAKLQAVLKRIGVHDRNQWVQLVHRASVRQRTPYMTNFERLYERDLRPYNATLAQGQGAVSHLQINNPEDSEQPYSDLVISSDAGGYIAEGYGVFQMLDEEGNVLLNQWFLNPFQFFNLVFQDDYLPKPDTATLLGRRIFYSHLDGDGWNNLTELEEYRKQRVLSSQVLYEKVFKPYREFGFTVGLIANELRADCYGMPGSIPIAKRVLSLPNVEAGSHTFSHPLHWGYFAKQENVAAEAEDYQGIASAPPGERFFISEWILGERKDDIGVVGEYDSAVAYQAKTDLMRGIREPYSTIESRILEDYKIPRSYACEPFNLDLEIRGSVDYINQLVPGKPVKIYQWSGNTLPFEAAIRETRKLGIPNINGGDSRFDSEYPSYASIAPLSVQIGDERQIYSSNSNENTYTNLWTGRFYGFRYLKETVDNTAGPVRIDPFNVYFHTYSGEKQAALNALLENLEYARSLDLFPIFTSDYAQIANSFFDTQFIPLAKNKWRIENRGEVQSIRLNRASLRQVDFSKSVGVIGQRHFQSSLYVALDPAVVSPILATRAYNPMAKDPECQQPYIVESNWKIKDLHLGKDFLTFSASGLGEGKVTFQLCMPAEVIIQRNSGERALNSGVIATNRQNQLQIRLAGEDNNKVVKVQYTKK